MIEVRVGICSELSGGVVVFLFFLLKENGLNLVGLVKYFFDYFLLWFFVLIVIVCKFFFVLCYKLVFDW